MGKSLIITEKPSVAREFANVLGVSGRRNGYIENQDYIITWCVGHLVGLVYPEDYDIKLKKWRLEDLPFLPKDYKYDVIKNVRDQYNIVHGFLNSPEIDRVYWAGDAGKEGQTIEENIRNFGGVRSGMEELRVWIDSQTEEEISRGIREAKPMSAYANLGKSGIMRTIEDYAMGINFSRVMSIKYGGLVNRAANTSGYQPIAVGRVMTCVLGMVVEREREIRNFKETPFYRIVGNFTEAGVEAEWRAAEGSVYFESPKLYKENGIKEEKDAQALIDSLKGKQASILSLEKSTSRKKAPLLFNLAELQAECTKRFKISPDQALQCAQDLYEKKMTTYPRTDARVLSTAVAKEIYKNISPLQKYDPVGKFAGEIMAKGWHKNIAKTQYTDDSKVTDHYAIIPTGDLRALNSLNSLQRSVYELIVRRFLSIFYPPAEYENVKMTVGVEKEKFFASARVLKVPGYLEVANPPQKNSGSEEKSDGSSARGKNQSGNQENYTEQSEETPADPKILLSLAQTLKKGDKVSTNGYQIRSGKTSPPKRYTSGSMVLAMENAGQLIEDEELRAQIKGSGIGTSATRAEIIAKLVRNKYLNLNPKTQILTPENLGEMIYEVVRMTVPAMLNPKMTASWEKGLDGITRGSVEFWDYRTKLEDYIRRETMKMIGEDISDPLSIAISDFVDKKAAGVKRAIGVKCPVCKEGEIITTPFGYGCSRYSKDKSGCNFTVGQIAGLDIPEEEVKKLITDGHTNVLKGFQSKAGRKFSAALKMAQDEKGKMTISFDFNDDKGEILEGMKCPVCGGAVVKTPYGFRCENHKQNDPKSCKFTIGTVAGKTITQADVEALIREGRTETIRGFKSKAGKRFDACLALKKNEKGEVTIAFDFDNAADDLLPENVKCPVCGGRIKKTAFGFGCVNYNGDDPASCRFSIGQIASKKLSAANVTQLLTEGHTETIRGFKGKSGKKFDACLQLTRDSEGKPVINFDFGNVEAKKIPDVKCPLCGGDIVATPFGYGCANYDKTKENSCKFSIGKMAEKKLTEGQVKQLLTEGCTETIRGFKSKTGKKFDACVALAKDESGKVTGLKFDFDHARPAELKDVKCPKCGGKIQILPYGYACENHKNGDPASCPVFVGTVASVKLTQAQAAELFTKGKTGIIEGFVARTGMKFDAPLKLTEAGTATFDFPEKEEPKESGLLCPKCQKPMKKSRWQYICDCGFKISHTVAKVPLSEDVMKELLTTGKTKDKVIGFTSKAGNVFDACLKYEDGQIRFDFDNPGSSPAGPNGSGGGRQGSLSKSEKRKKEAALEWNPNDDNLVDIEVIQAEIRPGAQAEEGRPGAQAEEGRPEGQAEEGRPEERTDRRTAASEPAASQAEDTADGFDGDQMDMYLSMYDGEDDTDVDDQMLAMAHWQDE